MSDQLSADSIIEGYKKGIYPMNTDEGLKWFAPSLRCIIELDHFHVSRRLARKYRQKTFTMKVNTAWNEVLFHCANRENTWISEEIKNAYTELHERELAHSIEAYLEDELVGGLYGVHIGGAFMAESMFHLRTDASKFCLVYLVEVLKKQRFVLLDTQDFSKHKAGFGATMIPKAKYLEKLGNAISLERQFLS